MCVQPSDSSWVTPNAAAPVPRFGTVTLPVTSAAPRPPFPDSRQTSAAPPPSQAPLTSAPPPPPVGQLPSRFGVPPAAVSTARSVTVDSTETITVTNVVSAPAINKLGSLFNSLNKTVTGALNTFITQQQQQPQMPGSWQPVNQYQQQLQQQQLLYPHTSVQRFSAAPLSQTVSFTSATSVVPPQPQLQAPLRPAGATRLPSDASSAFVRVGPNVGPQTRLDAIPPQHRPPPPVHHHHAAPPLVRNHVQQPPHIPPQFTDGEIYRELPRNHVEPRMHRSPPGRGK